MNTLAIDTTKMIKANNLRELEAILDKGPICNVYIKVHDATWEIKSINTKEKYITFLNGKPDNSTSIINLEPDTAFFVRLTDEH